MTDIDIDFAQRDKALDGLSYVFAVERGAARRRHPTGVYFQNIPIDPIDTMAVWDYEVAEQKGYFKLDLLHNTIYRDVRDESHLTALLATEPPWHRLADSAVVCKLAHIGRHNAIVQSITPTSVEDLAVCIALIRPGKAHLVGRPRHEIDRDIWLPTEKYYFKRSHALSYAATIVVQLNLLIEQHVL
jgi:hypothetical protein